MSAAVRAPLPGFVPWPDDVAARYRALGCWTGETFGELLRRRAAAHPDRLALVCGERRWRYADLDAAADRLAAGLHRAGIGARDRVVVQLPNVGEFFVVVFALFSLGALPVFAQPAHRQAEIGHFLRHAEAKAWVIAAPDPADPLAFDHRALARQVLAGLDGASPRVIVAGEAREFTALAALEAEGAATLAAAPAGVARETGRAAPALPPGPTADEVAFLQLSGGSTGLPKLIARTHDDYAYSIRRSNEVCGIGEDAVYLCALPVAHNFPLSSPGTLGVLMAGGCVVLAPRPDADTCFRLIAAHRVTITAVVPPLAQAWLDAARTRRPDLSSLRWLQVGGARLADDIARRIGAELGCPVQQVFGMAEGLVNYTRADDPPELVVSTQGRPMSPFDELRVVDDDDRDLPDGTPGHLLARGPYTIRGYYRAEPHNARAFTADGYYRTGDIVRRLPGGHLVVEGRAKDQINRGGDKIAAEEVEGHLLAHPAVFDAALVGLPDAWLGERGCAVIVARGPAPKRAALVAFLRERGLADYKLPDRVEVVDALPKTAVGKVDKRALRARFGTPPGRPASAAPTPSASAASAPPGSAPSTAAASAPPTETSAA